RSRFHSSDKLTTSSPIRISSGNTTTTARSSIKTAAIMPSASTISSNGERASQNIPTFDGTDEKSKATDFANYFCAVLTHGASLVNRVTSLGLILPSQYAQLYHQKQMLTDHNRMAAYHAAIVGNADIFKDKVVMDVGTGSGILAVWAAQAGAKRVYAIEYTDMANHARRVVKANGVEHIVTVIQGAVEDVILPQEDWDGIGIDGGLGLGGLTLEVGDVEVNEDGRKNQRVVDIILSEWMGYFLLRESMLDSLVRARDTFLKPKTGLMMPSHATMLLAPISDEEERRVTHNDYANAMDDWREFAEVTSTMYGVDMSVLEQDYDREQKEYYVMSSRWAELRTGCLLADPIVVKEYDMHTCTVEDARGVGLNVGEDEGCGSPIEFDVVGRRLSTGFGSADGDSAADFGAAGPISGFAGWFTVDFKSRTDEVGRIAAPEVSNPAHLSTGPEMGYTHWGQQVFHFPSAIPLLPDQTTRIVGTMEMMRTKESARLYNVRFRFTTSRRKTSGSDDKDGRGAVLMKGKQEELVYQMP
ncbi:hypothetical protein ACHAXA_009104, partial [Cyclostephanos tholiformis]